MLLSFSHVSLVICLFSFIPSFSTCYLDLVHFFCFRLPFSLLSQSTASTLEPLSPHAFSNVCRTFFFPTFVCFSFSFFFSFHLPDFPLRRNFEVTKGRTDVDFTCVLHLSLATCFPTLLSLSLSLFLSLCNWQKNSFRHYSHSLHAEICTMYLVDLTH